MFKLSVFLIITIIEFLVIFYYWNKVDDIHTVGKIASSLTGFREKYDAFISRIINYLKELKPLMAIVIFLILLFNYLVTLILAFIVSIIMLLI